MSFLTKLTLLFMVLSLIPMAIIGYMAFDSAGRYIEQVTISHLVSMNILKESALASWIDDSEIMLRQLAARPLVATDITILDSSDAASAEYKQAYARIIQAHFGGTLNEKRFKELFVLQASSGKVLVFTGRNDQDGKYRDNEQYFVQGKIRTFVQNPYFSIGLDEVIMTISTPVTDGEGRLIAVLAGNLDLSEMSGIIQQRSGLSATEETYLVNKFNFFITDPRQGQELNLRKSVHTAGVEAGLAHQDGVGVYDNYNGVPVIGAYRWIPAREMCIVTEVSQAEAFEPVAELRNSLLIIGVVIALLAAIGGILFALTITGPLQKLAKGADEIGRGNLDYRIAVKSRDEIGRLANAFNEMTANYKRVEKEKLDAEARGVAAKTTVEMMQSMPDPVFANDMKGRITQINTAVTTLLGYGQEIIGESPTVLVAESEVPRALAVIEEMVEVGFLRNKEFILKAKDGKHIPVLLNGVLRKDRDGNPVGMVVVLRDITEIKKAEETLKESEERFRIASSSASDTIWEWDIPSGRLDWYGKIDEILGYQPGEFPRTIEGWEKAIHSDDIGHVNATLEQHLKDGTPYADEYRIQRKDGTYRYWVDHGAASRNGKGEPVKMIGACSDITGRKLAEEEILNLNAGLEQRVLERTSLLETANKELEAFAYSVSHDLRAPLRGIDGWSLALLEDYKDKLDEQGRQYIDLVRSETQIMGRLIDDLLMFSRQSRAEMNQQRLDMTVMAQAIVSRLQQQNPTLRADFIIQPGLTALGDTGLIEIALTNLLDNAVKFSSKNSRAVIEFGQVEQQGREVFFVRDNGVGFDMAYANKLFGVFRRLHKASEFPGTGIGLASVQRIIARHGGRIWAEAKLNEGATFYFTLKEAT